MAVVYFSTDFAAGDGDAAGMALLKLKPALGRGGIDARSASTSEPATGCDPDTSDPAPAGCGRAACSPLPG